MKKSVKIVVIFLILMLISSVCLAKDCTLTRNQIDVYLSRLENGLPTLEKQVDIIIRLLQNDKD